MSKKTEAPSGFDLSELDSADESHMTVNKPDGTPTDWVWTFAGPGHPKSIEQSNRLSRERLAQDRAQEQSRVNGKKWRAPEETVDEVQAKNVGFVVERLIGWSKITLNGDDLPFTTEAARKLLLDRRKQILLRQALEFLGDENAFTKRSANS